MAQIGFDGANRNKTFLRRVYTKRLRQCGNFNWIAQRRRCTMCLNIPNRLGWNIRH